MKLTLFTLILLSIFFNTNAQDTPSDTLQPIKTDTVMPADSTSEEEEEEEGEEEEEEEKDDTPAKFRYRIAADGTYTSGNVNRALIQFSSALDFNNSKIIKFSSSPSYIYGQQNKVLAEKELFIDFRTSILHERKFYYLAFTSFEKSNLRKINDRFIGAAGVGLKLFNDQTPIFLQQMSFFMKKLILWLMKSFLTATFGEIRLVFLENTLSTIVS